MALGVRQAAHFWLSCSKIINTDKERDVSKKADLQLRQGDGYCAVEIRMKAELWFEGRDHATPKELKEAAIAVFAGCVLKHTTGGVSRYHGRSLPSIYTSNKLYFTPTYRGTARKAY